MSDTRTYIKIEFYFLRQKTGDDLSQDFFPINYGLKQGPEHQTPVNSIPRKMLSIFRFWC